MAILASLQGVNLFTSLPSTPPPPLKNSSATSISVPPPPIPIPKYPPPSRRNSKTTPVNPALKLPHRQTHYYKPVKEGVIATNGDRAVVIGDSGVSYQLPGAPFEFQYSYTEIPKVKPVGIREPAFLPFAPPTMPRPWTGKAPLKKSKKNIPLFDSFYPPPAGKRGVKFVEMPGPFPFGKYPKEGKSREEILGEPLKKWEMKLLVKPLLHTNKQVNLGRDGLTHNMLELVHTHWKRQRVCKVRCKGVPTVDMDNVCRVLEEKTGGKIIFRVGGVVYLFRGRNYNYRTRPEYPLMLWKPATPVYPKLIQEAPEGLTKAEADKLRKKGKSLLPICKLAKNGVYISLVKDVSDAFELSPVVKVDCEGMHATDYKKLGAKLKELVPCVLLSFDKEQILMWRGRDWKSKYPVALSASISVQTDADNFGTSVPTTMVSSPKMLSLWTRAIDSNKALLLEKLNLGPDDLLMKVEEFESVSQAADHSDPALILSSQDHTTRGTAELNTDEIYRDDYDDEIDAYGNYESDSDEEEDTLYPFDLGSLPVDHLATELGDNRT